MVNISKKNVHLFFGIVLSVFVLLQSVQITSTTVETKVQADQKNSEKENSEKETKTTISQAQAITNSSSQINLGFDSYLLDVVTFKEERDDKKSSTALIITSVNNAIRVLLQKIISPNAP